MDEAPRHGRDVLVHCKVGQHRSASVAVLYMTIRGGVGFWAPWLALANRRGPIYGPFDYSEHKTYMTRAFALWLALENIAGVPGYR